MAENFIKLTATLSISNSLKQRQVKKWESLQLSYEGSLEGTTNIIIGYINSRFLISLESMEWRFKLLSGIPAFHIRVVGLNYSYFLIQSHFLLKQ